MSLIPDYANAVGSAMSYNRKRRQTQKGKEKTDGNASSEKTGKANKADKTDRTGKTGTVTGRTIGNPKLSEKAAKYYEELKRKIFQYGLYSGQRGSEGEGKGRRREAMPMHRRWWFSSTRTRLSAWRRMKITADSTRRSLRMREAALHR